MPVELTLQAAKWLQSLKVISGHQTLSNGRVSLLYNDQMYLQNGFIVGQILRSVLKASGSTSQGLLRVRKIAHISSNQNWRILGEILSEIGFREFDPEEIDVQLMQDVVEFLFNKFNTKPSRKKQKVTHIDTHSFQPNKPIESAKNVLQFMLLSLNQAFSVSLAQIFGLLVDKGRYLIQTIILGSNDLGYQPVVQFYQVLIRNVAILNELLAEEYGGEDKIMDLVGFGLISENAQVCQLCCLFIESADSEWIEGKGINMMLRSVHSQGLDLLMRRLSPNFDSVFNVELYKRFDGRFLLEMKVYARLLKYYYHSLHGKQLIKHLQIPYYISKAFELFEPDRKERPTSQERIAVRYLFCVAYRYFSRRLSQSQMSKLFYSFDPKQTESVQEQIASLCILFQLLYEIIARQRELSLKLFNLSWSYYQQCSHQIKTFIIENLKHLLSNNPTNFPVSLFLGLHQPTSILQHNQFSILMSISEGDGLNRQSVDLMLKTCIIYYYQQLSARGVLDVIVNLIKKYQPIAWGQQISQQILAKWTKLQIPPYQPLPAQSKKIKYRSVGLKKKEMMQFTELNRYKKILLALVQLSNRNFLAAYAKNIAATIAKVEKSKIKQMQNTKVWLNNLLALIDAKAMELKERKIATPVEEFQTESLIVDEESRYFIEHEREDQNYGRLVEYSQNQFMKEEPGQAIKTQKDPLLPFSQQDIQCYPLVSQQLFFQNFQLIYLRSLSQKHSQLLHNLTLKYSSASCLSDFLQEIGILQYLHKERSYLEELNTKLILAQDEPSKRVTALMVQAALIIFEFKKSRRVTIKCVESFYQLLEEKNTASVNESKLSSISYKPSNASSKMVSKVQFQSAISPLHKRNNQKILNYIDCFEMVSWLLEKSIGIAEIQPLSKVVSEVDPALLKHSPSDQSVVLQEQELKELQQLERIIEVQSRINATKDKQYRSTPMKKRQQLPLQPVREDKDVSQRWAEVQKRIILRRRQLQAKQAKGKS